MPEANSRKVEEIVIPPEKKTRIITQIEKLEDHKISKLLNNSTVSKFVTRKRIEVNNLSGDQ